LGNTPFFFRFLQVNVAPQPSSVSISSSIGCFNSSNQLIADIVSYLTADILAPSLRHLNA
jgi:hypothetical protein